MGNCCLERPRRGGCGGGGGCANAVHYSRTNPVWVEEEVEKEARRNGEGEGEGAAPAAAATTTEVKIRITRKQLEELLRRVESGKHAGGGGAPVQEVISELLSVVNTSSMFRHREEEGQWRPSLQTIPE